ncbi:CRP-like cAMP-binding protein [Actinophytocola oryzae]|uniref:CRP-like cAMP-binding protein n=2 Tax=Actinophytocola oryzae TaxID=502181 RepID=A0A4R7UPX3_9PSEU|nr:CRP-like cAMP-binding protein [Actinophytocola oryzae]
MVREHVADLRAIVREERGRWSDSALLARLDPGVLQEFLDASVLVRFDRNAVLVRQDGTDTDIYLLLSSYVKVTAKFGDGRSALLAIRAGGDVVGELAASGGGRRIATVIACAKEPVYAAKIAATDFLWLASRHPASLVLLTNALGRKLTTATRRRVDNSGRPPLIRLARVLVELADDHGVALTDESVLIGVDLTQFELGSLIGMRESSVLRALRELKQQNLVDTSGRRPVVRNLEMLRAIAYPAEDTVK